MLSSRWRYWSHFIWSFLQVYIYIFIFCEILSIKGLIKCWHIMNCPLLFWVDGFTDKGNNVSEETGRCFNSFVSPTLKEVTVKAGNNLCIKILLKPQMLLSVFVQFSSWSSDVGLTVHSFSVDVFQLYSVQKYFAINMELFSKDFLSWGFSCLFLKGNKWQLFLDSHPQVRKWEWAKL